MSEPSSRGADRITVGTSDFTMRIWQLVDDAGDDGLSRDEIVELVAPHVNAGYARRRYLSRLNRTERHRSDTLGMKVARVSTWEDIEVGAARSYVIRKTLENMRQRGSLVRGEDDRYRAGRKPRYLRDERKLDLNGDLTRLHMNGNEALRALKPALERRRQSHRAQLSTREWDALERLVELFEEQMRAGFPTIP